MYLSAYLTIYRNPAILPVDEFLKRLLSETVIIGGIGIGDPNSNLRRSYFNFISQKK